MDMITKSEAAAMLGVSVRTVERMATRGELTAYKLRGSSRRQVPVRYRRDQVIELASRSGPPAWLPPVA